MIKIVEINPPLKVSGISSFLVSFKYNQAIVDAIKTVPAPTVWLAKEKCWEIPVTSLAALLDTLTFLDDIELTVINPETNEISEFSYINAPEWFRKFIKLH